MATVALNPSIYLNSAKPQHQLLNHPQIMATTATWDYSIYDVSGLSHDEAWKKLRDLPLPPISDQLASYYQQRVAQSAHFEDVKTLIANNHDDDDDDEDEPPLRAKTGLLSPCPSSAPATPVNKLKNTLHDPNAISTSASHPSLQDWPPSPKTIPKSLKSRNSPLPRRLPSPRNPRRLSSAMTTRSRSTLHTTFIALNSKGKPESARELESSLH